jgi:hypothetical protein
MEEGLGSIRAYHPRSIETFTFYEVYDQWLGPWGESGYPLGYGKYYNVQFTSNQPLMHNPNTRQWVERTTVCLQNALIALAVARYQEGTLAAITEQEVREAAFNSHVSCYVRSGLSLVLMTDPLMIAIIGMIPIREFVPFSGNAAASWSQAIQSLVRAPTLSLGYSAATLMPAHSGILGRAVRMDAQRRIDMLTFSQRLGRLRSDIEQGRLDHLPWLDQIIRELDRMYLPASGDLRFAREVLDAALARRRHVIQRYRNASQHAPTEIREGVERMIQRSSQSRP